MQKTAQKPRLSLRQSAILEYVRQNPGCTTREIAAACSFATRNVQNALAFISNSGYALQSSRIAAPGEQARYTVTD